MLFCANAGEMRDVPDEGRVNVMLKPELSRRIKFGTPLWGERFLNRILYGVYGAAMVLILVLCLTARSVQYHNKGIEKPTGLLVFAVSLIFVGSFCCMAAKTAQKQGKKTGTSCFFLAVSLVFLVLQVLWVRSYYFQTGWDAGTVMKSAVILANGESLQDYNWYYSVYPNNLVLLLLYSNEIRLFRWLHIVPSFGIVLVQCLLSWASGLLLYGTTRNMLKDEKAAMAAWGLYVLLVGLSPWVSIPYSDSTALIFPIAILYLYTRQKQQKGWKKACLWGAIGLLTMLGYHIKPQVAIATIAICGIELWNGLFRLRACLRNKSTWCGAASFMVAFCLAAALVNAGIETLPLEINSEQTLDITHWWMMGMNDGETNGAFNQEDRDFSCSIPDRAERKQANIEEALRRIQKMGPSGFLNLMHCKVLTNYNDGTFCWGGEGGFYVEPLADQNLPWAPVAQKLYGGTLTEESLGEGSMFALFYKAEWVLWMSILMCGALGALLGLKKLRTQTAAAMLSILGLTLFEQLFEARARYLYSYTPVYILLAAVGLWECKTRLTGRGLAVIQEDAREQSAENGAAKRCVLQKF